MENMSFSSSFGSNLWTSDPLKISKAQESLEVEEDEKPKETIEEPESLLSMLANEVKASRPKQRSLEGPRSSALSPQPFGIPTDSMLRDILGDEEAGSRE